MKKLFVLGLWGSISCLSIAQDEVQLDNAADDNVYELKLDMLNIPQSPTASVMGFAESEIIKPSNPTDFMVALQNAADNATELSSFALDMRVSALFGDTSTWERFIQNNEIPKNIMETATFSVGYKNYDLLEDSIQTGQGMGLGFKFSLFRGDPNKEVFAKNLETKNLVLDSYESLTQEHSLSKEQTDLIEKLADSLAHIDTLIAEQRSQYASCETANCDQLNVVLDSLDELYKIYSTTESYYSVKISKVKNRITEDVNEDLTLYYGKLASAISDDPWSLYGWSWDFAGALVLNFPDNRFDFSKVQQTAFWTTLGYTGKNGLTGLGMLRLSYHNDLLYFNSNNFIDTSGVTLYDFGIRLLYEPPQSGLSVSMESVLRGVPNTNIGLTPSFNFVLGYHVWKNARLSFTFGTDFKGYYTLENNIVSQLNLNFGIGSKRYVKGNQLNDFVESTTK